MALKLIDSCDDPYSLYISLSYSLIILQIHQHFCKTPYFFIFKSFIIFLQFLLQNVCRTVVLNNLKSCYVCNDNPISQTRNNKVQSCVFFTALRTLQQHLPSFLFHYHQCFAPESWSHLHANRESPCRPDVLSCSPRKTRLQHHGPQGGQCRSDTIVVD